MSDESDANCKLETHCVKSTAYCASAGSVKVSFPIIVNFKPIAQGDEIIVFKNVATVSKPARTVQPVLSSSKAKKPRV